MNDLVDKLRKDFKDKEYRHGYVDEFLNMSIATQIKVLREQRGWSQKDLAERAGMKQPRISAIENINYYRWSIETLRRLAEAFDITLCVAFEAFGRRVEDIQKFSRENLERASFEDDPVFSKEESATPDAPCSALSHKALSDVFSTNVVHYDPFSRRKNPFAAGKTQIPDHRIGIKEEVVA
ncbi:MAG: helix-turn-helix domain-containing protein [Syntrophobacteraceae bacterium]